MSSTPMNPLTSLDATWTELQENIQVQNINLQKQLEGMMENIGQAIKPMLNIPFLQSLADTPGLNWLAKSFGQVNLGALAQEIETLKNDSPAETTDTLAQKVIEDTSLKASGIGLATNFLPVMATNLFAFDVVAIATLEIELVYKIAALYDFDIQENERQSEVIAIYLCTAGSSALVKSGLSLPEKLPGLGAIIGASSNAGILWIIGQTAKNYYKTKREQQQPQMIEVE